MRRLFVFIRKLANIDDKTSAKGETAFSATLSLEEMLWMAFLNKLWFNVRKF